MKKTLSILLLSATLLASTGVASAAALGTEAVNSDATIQMKAGNGPVTPVDPDKPTEPGEGGTGQTGPMQINYVSNLEFGNDVEITSGTTKANVKNAKTPYFQISDLRGTGDGWALKATLGDFTSAKDSARKIAGATLTFNAPQVATNNPDGEEAAVATGKQVLNAGGGSAVMMKAEAGNGRGTWLLKYPKAAAGNKENDKITFEAPSKNIDVDTQYKAVITWELYDGPTV